MHIGSKRFAPATSEQIRCPMKRDPVRRPHRDPLTIGRHVCSSWPVVGVDLRTSDRLAYPLELQRRAGPERSRESVQRNRSGISFRDEEDVRVFGDKQRFGVVRTIGICRVDRLNWTRGGITWRWFDNAIERDVPSVPAVVANICDIQTRSLCAWPDGNVFPVDHSRP